MQQPTFSLTRSGMSKSAGLNSPNVIFLYISRNAAALLELGASAARRAAMSHPRHGQWGYQDGGAAAGCGAV